MSRKPTRKKPSSSHHHPSHATPIITVQELERRWMALHLQVETTHHLRSLLAHEGGVALVLSATDILAFELKREERKVVRSLWNWGGEELRLLLLHEGCEHVIGSGHILLDMVLAWNLLHGPGSLLYVVLPVLALGLLLLSYYLLCLCRRRRAV